MNKLTRMKKLFFICAWLFVVSGERLILTNYLARNQYGLARNLSKVTNLPNSPAFESYSGYFTVEARYNSNLFFWFFPAFVSSILLSLSSLKYEFPMYEKFRIILVKPQ